MNLIKPVETLLKNGMAIDAEGVKKEVWFIGRTLLGEVEARRLGGIWIMELLYVLPVISGSIAPPIKSKPRFL